MYHFEQLWQMLTKSMDSVTEWLTSQSNDRTLDRSKEEFERLPNNDANNNDNIKRSVLYNPARNELDFENFSGHLLIAVVHFVDVLVGDR